jgi:4-oxalocrotonate tautomerase
LYERGNVWPIQKKFTEERPMPFVNIRLYEGHGKERKDELAKRVTEAVHEVCRVPREAVWVVFEEVPPTDWYAAGAPGQPVKR